MLRGVMTLACVLGIACACLAGACSTTAKNTVDVTICEEGDTRPCALDACEGHSTCNAEGKFGDCVCGSAGPDGGGATSASSLSTASGTSMGGTTSVTGGLGGSSSSDATDGAAGAEASNGGASTSDATNTTGEPIPGCGEGSELCRHRHQPGALRGLRRTLPVRQAVRRWRVRLPIRADRLRRHLRRYPSGFTELWQLHQQLLWRQSLRFWVVRVPRGYHRLRRSVRQHFDQ